jgi:S1-C subfamily serine protease
VEQCRCGEKRPAFVYDPSGFDAIDQESSRRSLVTTALVILVSLAGFFYWFHWYRHRPVEQFAISFGPADSRPTPAAATPLPVQTAAVSESQPPIPVPGDLTIKPSAEAPIAAGAVASTGGAPASLEDMIAAAAPAVVLIETGTGRGSGFYVRPDLLVTNAHVVRGSSTVTVKFADGKSGAASVRSVADNLDLALLKPAPGSEGTAVLGLSSITRVRTGQEVVAIGSALGVLQNTVTRGIVSALRNDGGLMLLQTDAAINPGNSGGPLLDRTGQVVGVNTMKVGEAASIGFAVAADHVRALIDTPSGTPIVLHASADAPSRLMPAQPSSTDAQHTDAVGTYERQLTSLAQRADEIDSYWSDYKKSCPVPSIPAGQRDREWFGVWAAGSVNSMATASGCSSPLHTIVQFGSAVKNAMESSNETARRAGVFPGEARDLRRKYRLEWDGWNR